MKLNDKKTKDIAAAVSDVLEGKKSKKKYEEAKYPHDMFHPETGEKEVAKDEKDHKALSKKGYTHEKPEVKEVEEPKAKGEKEFKKKHVIKKSGEEEDGTVVKEDTDAARKVLQDIGETHYETAEAWKAAQEKKKSLEEKKLIIYKSAKLKAVTSKLVKGTLSFKSPARVIFVDRKGEEVPVSIDEETNEGILDKKPLITKTPKKKKGLVLYKPMKHKALISKLAKGQLSIMVPQPGIVFVDKKGEEVPLLVEDSVVETKVNATEESERQKKYKAFFQKALKKFGVSSPAELKGEKKKEFFDYVDANYEAENEED